MAAHNNSLQDSVKKITMSIVVGLPGLINEFSRTFGLTFSGVIGLTVGCSTRGHLANVLAHGHPTRLSYGLTIFVGII